MGHEQRMQDAVYVLSEVGGVVGHVHDDVTRMCGELQIVRPKEGLARLPS